MNEKIHFVCLLKKRSFKDNVKTAHGVSHSQLRSLDKDDFFKSTPVVDETQVSVNRNIMKHSVSRGKRINFFYNEKKKMELKRVMMMLM